MNLKNILNISCDFCSDIKYIDNQNYIIIENLFIEEHKKSYIKFDGQEYIDIIEKNIDTTKSVFLSLYIFP